MDIEELKKLTVAELRKLSTKEHISGIYKFNKGEIIDILHNHFKSKSKSRKSPSMKRRSIESGTSSRKSITKKKLRRSPVSPASSSGSERSSRKSVRSSRKSVRSSRKSAISSRKSVRSSRKSVRSSRKSAISSRKSVRSSRKSCESGKIVNPETGYCVKKDGAIGKKIIQEMKQSKKTVSPASSSGSERSSRKSVRSSRKSCESGKIVNPETGYCVKKDSAIGKKIIQEMKQSKKTVSPIASYKPLNLSKKYKPCSDKEIRTLDTHICAKLESNVGRRAKLQLEELKNSCLSKGKKLNEETYECEGESESDVESVVSSVSSVSTVKIVSPVASYKPLNLSKKYKPCSDKEIRTLDTHKCANLKSSIGYTAKLQLEELKNSCLSKGKKLNVETYECESESDVESVVLPVSTFKSNVEKQQPRYMLESSDSESETETVIGPSSPYYLPSSSLKISPVSQPKQMFVSPFEESESESEAETESLVQYPVSRSRIVSLPSSIKSSLKISSVSQPKSMFVSPFEESESESEAETESLVQYPVSRSRIMKKFINKFDEFKRMYNNYLGLVVKETRDNKMNIKCITNYEGSYNEYVFNSSEINISEEIKEMSNLVSLVYHTELEREFTEDKVITELPATLKILHLQNNCMIDLFSGNTLVKTPELVIFTLVNLYIYPGVKTLNYSNELSFNNLIFEQNCDEVITNEYQEICYFNDQLVLFYNTVKESKLINTNSIQMYKGPELKPLERNRIYKNMFTSSLDNDKVKLGSEQKEGYEVDCIYKNCLGKLKLENEISILKCKECGKYQYVRSEDKKYLEYTAKNILDTIKDLINERNTLIL